MPKIDVSEEQIQEIIRLQHSGTSWLGIEKITGVPRRAAQHRYALWERQRLDVDLSSARRGFAQEEMARHVDLLTNLGSMLVAVTSLPESPSMKSGAEDKLDQMLNTEIPPMSPIRSTDRDEREIIANRRRNQRLLGSLREHTTNVISWQRLEEWKRGWDACRSLLPRFGKEVDGMLATLLDEDQEAKGNIDKYAKGHSGAKAIGKAVLNCPWRLMINGDGKWAEAFSVRERVGDKKDLFELRCGDDQVTVFTDKDTADRALEICRKVMRKTSTLRVVKSLTDEVTLMQEVVSDFENKLNALELRPVILRTRCRICPA